MPYLHRIVLPPIILGTGLLILISCGGENLVRPTEGTLRINTITSGSDLDPDGYIVTVDTRPDEVIGVDDVLAIPNLAPGDHSVALSGVVSNCAVGGAAGGRTVTVVAGDTVDVTFRVNCESITPPPPPGGGDPLP